MDYKQLYDSSMLSLSQEFHIRVIKESVTPDAMMFAAQLVLPLEFSATELAAALALAALLTARRAKRPDHAPHDQSVLEQARFLAMVAFTIYSEMALAEQNGDKNDEQPGPGPTPMYKP
jgi:hypothetical protein